MGHQLFVNAFLWSFKVQMSKELIIITEDVCIKKFEMMKNDIFLEET